MSRHKNFKTVDLDDWDPYEREDDYDYGYDEEVTEAADEDAEAPEDGTNMNHSIHLACSMPTLANSYYKN